VLGWGHAFSNGKRFGLVRPRHVFLGGDPTGDVTGVRWDGWGAGKATGFGTGWCPGRSVADGYYCSVSLHAYDLGLCHGSRAYRILTFYFKFGPHRRWVLGSKWNACTGQRSSDVNGPSGMSAGIRHGGPAVPGADRGDRRVCSLWPGSMADVARW
jgi:hypothetical protein